MTDCFQNLLELSVDARELLAHAGSCSLTIEQRSRLTKRSRQHQVSAESSWDDSLECFSDGASFRSGVLLGVEDAKGLACNIMHALQVLIHPAGELIFVRAKQARKVSEKRLIGAC